MTIRIRALGAWVVFLASVGVSACGGGNEQPTATPQSFVSAEAAMAASAQSYQAQVNSFEGTMSIGFDADGETFATTGEMKYQSPDDVYISMEIPGFGEMQVLLDANDIYFAIDGEWYKGDASALGIDLAEFRKYAEDRGPVDYSEALEGLTDIVKLPDETIDGKSYWHYYAALDLDALSNELPEDLIDPALIEEASNALGSTTMDIFIDPITLLPRRYTMEMSMDFGFTGVEPVSFTMNMQMDFEKYNEDVDIPDPPEEAKEYDFSDLPGLDEDEY